MVWWTMKPAHRTHTWTQHMILAYGSCTWIEDMECTHSESTWIWSLCAILMFVYGASVLYSCSTHGHTHSAKIKPAHRTHTCVLHMFWTHGDTYSNQHIQCTPFILISQPINEEVLDQPDLCLHPCHDLDSHCFVSASTNRLSWFGHIQLRTYTSGLYSFRTYTASDLYFRLIQLHTASFRVGQCPELFLPWHSKTRCCSFLQPQSPLHLSKSVVSKRLF